MSMVNIPAQNANMFVIDTAAKDRTIYLDLNTDRELVLVDGYATSARQLTHRRAQRSFQFALSGREGYQFIRLDADELATFNKLYNQLTVS